MVESFITPENKILEIVSPSGRFKIILGNYKIEWKAYLSGILVRLVDGKVIAEIDRKNNIINSFFTKNNQDWYLSGKTYMSQNFINLDTEEVFDNTEKIQQKDQYKYGCSFYWNKIWLSPDGNTLAVEGCHWGIESEYKFFDFTDPSKGWPELKNDEYYDVGIKEPHWNPDHTFTFYDTEVYIINQDKLIHLDADEYFELSDEAKKNQLMTSVDDQITTIKREGDKIITVNLFQTPERKQRDKEDDESDQKRENYTEKLLNESVIYKKFKSELDKTCLNMSVGFTIGPTFLFCLEVKNYKDSDNIPKNSKKNCIITWGVDDGEITQKYWTVDDGVITQKYWFVADTNKPLPTIIWDRSLESVDNILKEIYIYFNLND